MERGLRSKKLQDLFCLALSSCVHLRSHFTDGCALVHVAGARPCCSRVCVLQGQPLHGPHSVTWLIGSARHSHCSSQCGGWRTQDLSFKYSHWGPLSVSLRVEEGRSLRKGRITIAGESLWRVQTTPLGVTAAARGIRDKSALTSTLLIPAPCMFSELASLQMRNPFAIVCGVLCALCSVHSVCLTVVRFSASVSRP